MSDMKTKQAGFFPAGSASSDTNISPVHKRPFNRNSEDRKRELESFKSDSHVAIDNAVKDFSRIKKAVDATTPIDKSNQVAKLKKQIDEGTYKIDHDKLADKIITSEFS